MYIPFREKWCAHKKPLSVMLIALGILFGGIFLYKGVIAVFRHFYFAAHESPTETVSSMTVQSNTWKDHIISVGNTRAVLGVDVTAQLSGMIQNIYFIPGTLIQQGSVLVQQNADTQIGQLHSDEANAELAKITYERDLLQYKAKGVSKQQVDTDQQNLKSAQAQVAAEAATVAKLTITAPFTGQAGI